MGEWDKTYFKEVHLLWMMTMVIKTAKGPGLCHDTKAALSVPRIHHLDSNLHLDLFIKLRLRAYHGLARRTHCTHPLLTPHVE